MTSVSLLSLCLVRTGSRFAYREARIFNAESMSGLIYTAMMHHSLCKQMQRVSAGAMRALPIRAHRAWHV